MILTRDERRQERAIGGVGIFGSILMHVAIIGLILTLAPRVPQVGWLDSFDGSTRATSVAARHPPRAQAMMDMERVGASMWSRLKIMSLRLRPSIAKWADHLWQSTLFAAVAGALTLALRRNRARVRYALWLAASIKFFIPFTLLVSIASFGGTLAWPRAIQRLSAGAPFVASGTAAMWPVSSSSAAAAAPAADWRVLALFAVWACGFLAIGVMRLRMWQRVQAMLESSESMDLPIATVPPMPVRAVSGLLEPGVVGWRRPVLLMPEDIDRHLAVAEIEAIVAHELCHVRRYDNLTASLHMIAEAIFWFHPLVWWIGARLVDERERACDEHVLRTVLEPRSYAQGILNVCKRYVASPLASVSGVSSANVPKRIEAILLNQTGDAIGPWKRIAIITVVALAVIVPVGVGASRDSDALQAGGASPVMYFSPRIDSYKMMMARENGELGPGMVPSTRTDCEMPSAPPCGPNILRLTDQTFGSLSADGMTMTELADFVSNVVNRRIEDRTGLTGRFAVRLKWTTDRNGQSLFAALRDQLGLKLEVE